MYNPKDDSIIARDPHKQAQREELERDIAAFLAKGGKIQQVGVIQSEFLDSEESRRNAFRIKSAKNDS
jgi:hypothetical protein